MIDTVLLIVVRVPVLLPLHKKPVLSSLIQERNS